MNQPGLRRDLIAALLAYLQHHRGRSCTSAELAEALEICASSNEKGYVRVLLSSLHRKGILERHSVGRKKFLYRLHRCATEEQIQRAIPKVRDCRPKPIPHPTGPRRCGTKNLRPLSPDQQALVEQHIHLPNALVRRFARRGGMTIPFEELQGEGYYGLVRAAGYYRSEQGIPFAPFAMIAIRHRLMRAIGLGGVEVAQTSCPSTSSARTNFAPLNQPVKWRSIRSRRSTC